MSLFLRGVSQPDWQWIIGALHDNDLDSPRRSTVPLVAYWRDPVARGAPLHKGLGFPTAEAMMFYFEYPVDVGGGSGKPSCTDLMIITRSAAIAIEAKYKEPPYQKVSKWLRQPPSENRIKVLRGWLDMLQTGTGVSVTVDAVHEMSYQLIHRAASSCFPLVTHRAVVYQLFDLGLRDYYLQQLRALRALIPPSKLSLAILATPATPSQSYERLLARWDDEGERNMASGVRSAVLDDSAFTFSAPSLSLV